MILPTARVLFAFNSPEIRHEFASTLLHLLKKINMTDSKITNVNLISEEESYVTKANYMTTSQLCPIASNLTKQCASV